MCFSSITNLDYYRKWNVYQDVRILLLVMRLTLEVLEEALLNHLNGELCWTYFLYIFTKNRSSYCFVDLILRECKLLDTSQGN